MNPFRQSDLVPLWDRPADFLPLRPPGGAHRWSFSEVKNELERVSGELDKEASARRVALLAHPDLDDAAATDGLHAGIQMLLPHEAADAHRHTPSALRVGLEGSNVVTFVNDEELTLGPLDVVLNPSGTWHGHVERAGVQSTWLDVVDLPLVAGLGGVLFEPTRAHQIDGILDPPSVPSVCRFAWADVEAALDQGTSVDGVSSHSYGGDSLMATIAVSAHRLDKGATLRLGARTCGAIALAARGSFGSPLGPIKEHDVVALRSWTPFSVTSKTNGGTIFMIDTSPALRALGLYREEDAI